MTRTNTKPHDTPTAGRGERTERREMIAVKVKSNAWLLAAVAIAFYVGFIAWNYLRGGVG